MVCGFLFEVEFCDLSKGELAVAGPWARQFLKVFFRLLQELQTKQCGILRTRRLR
jgi:hypothetical protein